jgi:hypothetical protein
MENGLILKIDNNCVNCGLTHKINWQLKLTILTGLINKINWQLRFQICFVMVIEFKMRTIYNPISSRSSSLLCCGGISQSNNKMPDSPFVRRPFNGPRAALRRGRLSHSHPNIKLLGQG